MQTNVYSQYVAMVLLPNENIGEETHAATDQQFIVVSRRGAMIKVGDGAPRFYGKGETVSVPAGTLHDAVNPSGEKRLKLIVVYSPPHHEAGAVHMTKAEGEVAERNT